MPEGFWYTILGGFLAGCFGLLLFLIQRYTDKKDEEQKILFQICNLLERPIRGRDFESFHESFDRLIDIGSLSLLIKDKKLKKEIFLYAYLSGGARKNAPEKKDLIKIIKQKLSKKLINEVGENLSNK